MDQKTTPERTTEVSVYWKVDEVGEESFKRITSRCWIVTRRANKDGANKNRVMNYHSWSEDNLGESTRACGEGYPKGTDLCTVVALSYLIKDIDDERIANLLEKATIESSHVAAESPAKSWARNIIEGLYRYGHIAKQQRDAGIDRLDGDQAN